MRFAAASALAVCLAVLSSACSAEAVDAVEAEDDLSTKAYAYTCTSPGSRVLEEADSIEIAVSNGLLRFTDGYGPNLGDRDATYRAPKNTSRARFRGFSYGGDCSLSLVVDDAALRGAPNPQLRVQCAGDDFVQDLYTCGAAKPTRLAKPKPPAPVLPNGPPAGTKTWTCTSPDGRILEGTVALQVDDDAMRLVADELVYEGTRDRAYKPKTGSFVRYDDFGYGGDCAMSAVVEEKAIAGTASSTVLKVRCAGDDFTQDTYACTPR